MDMNMSLYNVEMKTVSKRHKSSTSMGTNILSNPYLAIATKKVFKKPFSKAFMNVVPVIGNCTSITIARLAVVGDW